MKNILKLFSLLLALVLCLSLAACGETVSEEDQAFEAANALLEAGDYDGAIAAFSSIGRYQEIAAKIEEAIRLKAEANAGFLLGTWKDIVSGTTFIFESDSSVTMITTYPDGSSYESDTLYTYADGVVEAFYPFQVQEIDGVTHLVNADASYDLVPEANYADLCPITVEITMDNWQEYFELREAADVQDNAFGEPEYRSLGYAVMLKEEYIQRLVNAYANLNVSFEMQYDESIYLVTGDFVSGDYTLEEGKPYWYSQPLEQDATATTEVWDYRNNDYSQHSDLYGHVGGFFHGGNWYMEDGGLFYICKPINPEIIRVQGTMTLLR